MIVGEAPSVGKGDLQHETVWILIQEWITVYYYVNYAIFNSSITTVQ